MLYLDFFILFFLSSYSQDSTVIIQRGKIIKYRKGYLVTPGNDTLRGLIWIERWCNLLHQRWDKDKDVVAGNFTKIPYITAGDGSLKAFYRNGIFYRNLRDASL